VCPSPKCLPTDKHQKATIIAPTRPAVPPPGLTAWRWRGPAAPGMAGWRLAGDRYFK